MHIRIPYFRDFVAKIFENWIYKADHSIDTKQMRPISNNIVARTSTISCNGYSWGFSERGFDVVAKIQTKYPYKINGESKRIPVYKESYLIRLKT